MLQNLIEEREIQNAFFILSYIKKLCLHPFLLASTSAEKKRHLGLLCLTEEQELIARLQREEDERAGNQNIIRTRRGRLEH